MNKDKNNDHLYLHNIDSDRDNDKLHNNTRAQENGNNTQSTTDTYLYFRYTYNISSGSSLPAQQEKTFDEGGNVRMGLPASAAQQSAAGRPSSRVAAAALSTWTVHRQHEGYQTAENLKMSS